MAIWRPRGRLLTVTVRAGPGRNWPSEASTLHLSSCGPVQTQLEKDLRYPDSAIYPDVAERLANVAKPDPLGNETYRDSVLGALIDVPNRRTSRR